MRIIWLPVAAAVIAVVAAGALLVGGKSHASPPSPQLASYVGVPPYYVEMAANGNPDDVPSNAMVRATATGKLLATIKPLPGYTVLGATAAADDRTFVLDEAKRIGYENPSKPQAWQPRSYLLLRLNAAGLPVSLTRLPVTTVGLVTGVALSADGTRLAVADRPQPYSEYNPEQVRIYTLATGAVRIWAAQGTLIGEGQTQTGGSSYVPDDTASLSWTANGKWLAFDWSPFPGDASAVGTWLLNTALGGTSLLGDSRHVQRAGPGSASGCVDSAAARLTCEGDVIVTPDGSALICGATPDNDLFGPHVTDEYLKYSTATGKAHVLGSWGLTNVQVQAFGVRWSNSSGSILIASLPGSGNGRLGIIRGSTFTPLNVPDDAVPWMDGVWLPGATSLGARKGRGRLSYLSEKDITPAICLASRPVGIVPGFSKNYTLLLVYSPSHAAWSPADLRRLLSPGRFDRYVTAAGSRERAAQLYLWNARISGALHETLGMFEVVLRNALDRQLTAYHQITLSGNGHWYSDARMPWTSKKLTDQIDRARAQATANGKTLEIHGK